MVVRAEERWSCCRCWAEGRDASVRVSRQVRERCRRAAKVLSWCRGVKQNLSSTRIREVSVEWKELASRKSQVD